MPVASRKYVILPWRIWRSARAGFARAGSDPLARLSCRPYLSLKTHTRLLARILTPLKSSGATPQLALAAHCNRRGHRRDLVRATHARVRRRPSRPNTSSLHRHVHVRRPRQEFLAPQTISRSLDLASTKPFSSANNEADITCANKWARDLGPVRAPADELE